MTGSTTRSHNTGALPAPAEETASENHDPAELGELERAVLEMVWDHGVRSAEQVRDQLAQTGRRLKESTVRTVLRRLEEKGYVHHSVDNRTFLYQPAQSRQAVAGRAVRRIVDWFCEGSVEALLIGMVDNAVLDRDELRRFAERIAAAQASTTELNGEPRIAPFPGKPQTPDNGGGQ